MKGLLKEVKQMTEQEKMEMELKELRNRRKEIETRVDLKGKIKAEKRKIASTRFHEKTHGVFKMIGSVGQKMGQDLSKGFGEINKTMPKKKRKMVAPKRFNYTLMGVDYSKRR